MALAAVYDDIDEFEENVGAVEQHRPTDRDSRENERMKLKSALNDDDRKQLQGIIKEAGCQDNLYDEETCTLGN
jgi:hypothetical protein